MNPPPDAPILGRTLIRASAGSGKTFQLSSRLIGLLALGAAPESILASTFTRKAAGEILERVLGRLARAVLDGVDPACAGARNELVHSLPPGIPPERTTHEALRVLLQDVVQGLHRMQVLTLDAFVNRAVRAFSLELGLPAQWDLGDEGTLARLQVRALEQVLAEEDLGVLHELVRVVQLGKARRDVHRSLLEALGQVHGMYRERAAGADALWGFEGGVAHWPALPSHQWSHHADRVTAAGRTQLAEMGTSANWEKALVNAAQALRSEDAATLVGLTLWKNAARARSTGDEAKFDRKTIHPELMHALEAIDQDLPALVGPAWQRRVEALGRLVPRFDAHLQALKAAQGVYGFDDLVHALASSRGLGRADELYYRLDGALRHLLFDEFQDTSTLQWAALEPLVEELLSADEDRAFLVVADPKQSIYGWRGGEPRILDDLEARFDLIPRNLDESRRSSPVILDFVNRVFQALPQNPVLADALETPENTEIAERWMGGFAPHRAFHHDLPGWVELRAGPEAREGESAEDARYHEAALRIQALRQLNPSGSIGVLTRRNRVAARMMAELRALGVEASEEGGVPVADSSLVLVVLALLRAADHPHDRISAYLVAHSPLGALVGLEGAAYRDPRRVEQMGARVRARLLSEGYGPVVSAWAEALRPGGARRDVRRLDQLVELAWDWEAQATLRPTDFVDRVVRARREDPQAAPVRIMTIHRAKGLEFDVVVLPELEGSLVGGGGIGTQAALPFRGRPGGPVERIFPALPKELAACFPELALPMAQGRESELRDGLSTLYVALTRARTGLLAFLPPDGTAPNSRPSQGRTFARLIREASGLQGSEGYQPQAFDEKGRLIPGEVVFRAGVLPKPTSAPRTSDPDAHELGAHDPGAHDPSAKSSLQNNATLPLRASPRQRFLPRRSPSSLEGGRRVPLDALLAPRASEALDRGLRIHSLLESILWIDSTSSETPAAAEARRAPELLRPLAHPQVRRFLSQAEWPAGTTVERERPFVVRDDGVILRGVMDRVHHLPDGRVVLIDWKTDRVQPGDELKQRAAHYAPQLQAYLRALLQITGRAPDQVEGWLVFLEAGEAVRIELGQGREEG